MPVWVGVGGSPNSVIRAASLGLPLVLHHHEVLGHQRTLIQLAVGTVPHRDIMRAIELLGTKVAPAVRAEIARRTSKPAGQAATSAAPTAEAAA